MTSLPKSTEAVRGRFPLEQRPGLSHVVLDFDGTLSWLRHGWPDIMRQLFREHLSPQPGETQAELDALLMHLIVSLNGKPTIFQTLRFAELVQERTGRKLDGETLRQEYQRRLDEAITQRSAMVRAQQVPPDAFVVHGARALLEHLVCRSLTPIILSSTIEERVREEAELLDLVHYFGRHIYGGTGDPLHFSKRAVFERLLREEGIPGSQLLSFGDGPVEIADTKALGGLAIAVCSDEEQNGSGRLDPFKERQLMEAGADLAIPDFRDACELVDHLLGK